MRAAVIFVVAAGVTIACGGNSPAAPDTTTTTTTVTPAPVLTGLHMTASPMDVAKIIPTGFSAKAQIYLP